MHAINVLVAVVLLLACTTEARKDSVKRDVVQQARERVQARSEDADVADVILEVLDYIVMKLDHIEYQLSYHAPGFPNPAYPHDPAYVSSSGYYPDNTGYHSDPWSTDDYGYSSGDYYPGNSGNGYAYGHDSSARGYYTGDDNSYGGYDPSSDWYYSSDMYPSSSYSYDPYYDYMHMKRNKGAKLQKKNAEADLMKLLGQLKGELNKRKADKLN